VKIIEKMFGRSSHTAQMAGSGAGRGAVRAMAQPEQDTSARREQGPVNPAVRAILERRLKEHAPTWTELSKR
jgi:hypothetical protein